MRDFVHLHNHTHYSILDATCTPKELVDAAVKDGQQAVALTEHGVMFSALEFYNYAKKSGIKPLIGMEAYIASGSRFEKISGKSKDKKHRNYYHLILLAKDIRGYKNLLKITTIAHKEGFYYKPRIDKEILELHKDGLIACSACIGGVINGHLVAGEFEKAYNEALYYKNLFGDDFYVELQSHELPEDKVVLSEAPRIARELGIKLVASNDVHYISKEHAIAHNVFLLIKDSSAANSGTLNINDLRYRTSEMYFKSREQMNSLFRDFPEALDSTIEIANKCDIEFKEQLFMPDFQIPKSSGAETLAAYLREITIEGMEKRYSMKFNELGEDIRSRVNYELDVIETMKFPGYFLIVWDFVRAARELGVSVGPGRGSAAGSLVAYALGITNVNPLDYDLLFERFLNPERYSMPDIDIDFSDEGREKVIEYVRNKYGQDSVAMICTFGKLSSKSVLTDVGRVLGVPLSTVKDVTKKIPVFRGKVKPLKEAFDMAELGWIKNTDDPIVSKWRDYSLLLEDKIRSVGTHAAGVVIAPGDISNYVPLFVSPNLKKQNVDYATQYSMNELEKAGLLKMDFLGLRTLSIIDHTLDQIYLNHKVKIDVDAIDFHDKETYDLISSGRTTGIFQFESGGMQDYLKKLKPKSLEELTAMNALYRPGPMDNIPEYIDRKFGRKPIKYLHPIMEKSLKPTYGIIVYQEQVMQLVRDIAGFSLGQADILRRAMGKKKKSEMDAMKVPFLEGAAKNDIGEALANEIFDLIYKFADYGFNKSHSLAYSYLAFQTAWLKTHYPAEFLAANMTAELNDQAKIVSLIDEAKYFGIKVLPPDVNKSYGTFTASDKTITFGLAGIKNVGIGVESIISVRNERPFSTFYDFVSRVDSKLNNRRALEALIYAGAFDSLNSGHRAAFYASIDSALSYAKSVHEPAEQGLTSLFGDSQDVAVVEPVLQDVPPWSEKVRLEKEKEVLNFYISGHPLTPYRPFITAFSTITLGDKENKSIGGEVMVCGLISGIKTKLDKKNQTMAVVDFEDFTGKAEVLFWSDNYKKYDDILDPDSVVLISGKSDLNNENLTIIADTVYPVIELPKKFGRGYKITVDEANGGIEKIQQLFSRFSNDKSKTDIMFYVMNGKNYISSWLAQDVNIELSLERTRDLVELFGAQNVSFITR